VALENNGTLAMKLSIPNRFIQPLVFGEQWAQSLFLLALRLYVAWVFFSSGMVKIQSWDSTLSLFENEYAVPLLSPKIAAYLATFGELAFPIFLSTGAVTRLVALATFVLNAVAASSYPDLSDAGLADHWLWGTMLVVLFLFGPGEIAVDRWIWQKRS
jgi:putative oxidoreductase